MTTQTREYLTALVPPAPGQSPVPASTHNVSAQLLAVEAGVDAHPPLARVHVRGGRWVTVRAARFGHPGAAGSDIAVTLEEISASDRVEVFARCDGMTARESEVLALLVTGADTREISRRMVVSEHTVQDHLKSIFAKTACYSRPPSWRVHSAADRCLTGWPLRRRACPVPSRPLAVPPLPGQSQPGLGGAEIVGVAVDLDDTKDAAGA